MSKYRGPEAQGKAAQARMAAQQAALEALRTANLERRTYAKDAVVQAKVTARSRRYPKKLHARSRPWEGFAPSRTGRSGPAREPSPFGPKP